MTAASTDVDSPLDTGRHEYVVTASLCPQVLLRILGLFAQQSIIPQSIHCEQCENELHATVALINLSSQQAEILHAKIASIVMVQRVSLKCPS